MENLRPFQVGLLIAFAVVALISLLILASFQGFSGRTANPYGSNVTIWGTLDQRAFTTTLQELSRGDKNLQVVNYVQKDSRTFEEDLVDAIAEGNSPDAILFQHENLVSLRTKLQPIPYNLFPERTLRDNYVDGFEIFALSDGLYAVPFAVDPLIMYWNRDILAAGGLALPPATWESLTTTVEQITLRDATRNILQATVAFGEYSNVVNAKSILLTLLLQSGSRLIEESGTRYVVALDNSASDNSRRPLTSTLQFYVEFGNPASPLYSWNRTFQDDLAAFTGERLALYFGYGSEASRVRSQNPNLNFDTAAIPQGAGATTKRVYGKFYGFALVRAGKNQSGAYNAILALAGANSVSSITSQIGLAPAYRSLLSTQSGDATLQTIQNQALIARGWLDPKPESSSGVFKQMVEEVLSGRSQVGASASDTVRRLELAF